jgi:uncharacterized protein (DUF983 family)
MAREIHGGSQFSRTLRGLGRGFSRCCPQCGEATLFRGFLKIEPVCRNCGLNLGEFRADDAPPYFTVLIVGHIIIPALFLLERLQHPPVWLHMLIWIPTTLALTFLLLPRIKGAVIGTQWSLGIRG